MASKWEMYYLILSDTHRNKYNILLKDVVAKKKEYDLKFAHMNSIYDSFKSLENNTSIVRKLAKLTTYADQIDILRKHNPEYVIAREYTEIANVAYKFAKDKLTNFMASVYNVYDLPRSEDYSEDY